MDSITEIPLEQLHESPFNPRKTFTNVDELAASIRAEGRIHQPLLVRPITPNPLRDDIISGYEVVFGHRRLQAAELAGLATVPCMVRALTDTEARSAQIAENLQRQDVHPIEEAEGLQALIASGEHTADTLATLVGKSRSYVYGRLKLLDACDEVRTACLAGKIGSEVALLVARLRTPELQAKALAAIHDCGSQHARLDDGGQRSFRYIRDLLAERFTTDLAGALFAWDDATLLPAAGTCTDCTKRSGNAPEYADLAAPEREGAYGQHHRSRGGADICTDPDCYAAKKAAQLDRQAQALRDAGHEVVAGSKARQLVGADGRLKGGAYVALADVKAELKRMKAKAPASVMVQCPRTGKVIEAVRKDALPQQGDLLAEPRKPGAAGTAPGRSWKDEQAERQRLADIETGRRLRLLKAVRAAAAARERGTDELRIVLAQLLADAWRSDYCDLLCTLHGWDSRTQPGDFDDALQMVHAMPAEALAPLLLDLVLCVGTEINAYGSLSDRPEALDAMAVLYGVDVEAAQADPAAAAEAPTRTMPKGVKYHNPATGETWTGRGLKPAWLRAALEAGRNLADFAVAAEAVAA